MRRLPFSSNLKPIFLNIFICTLAFLFFFLGEVASASAFLYFLTSVPGVARPTATILGGSLSSLGAADPRVCRAVVGGLLALLREHLIGIQLLVEVLPARLGQHVPQAGLSGRSRLLPIVVVIVLVHIVVAVVRGEPLPPHPPGVDLVLAQVHVVNVNLLAGVKVQIFVLCGYVPLIEILSQGGHLFR